MLQTNTETYNNLKPNIQSSEASDGSSSCISLRDLQGEVQCMGKSKDFLWQKGQDTKHSSSSQ